MPSWLAMLLLLELSLRQEAGRTSKEMKSLFRTSTELDLNQMVWLWSPGNE